MKDNLSEDEIRIETQSLQQQETEKKFLGSLVKKRGHKIWMLNLENGLISELGDEDYKKYVTFDGVKKTEIIIKGNHLYNFALNKKNAFKVFSRMLANVDPNSILTHANS
jgi:hypothetical protein